MINKYINLKIFGSALEINHENDNILNDLHVIINTENKETVMVQSELKLNNYNDSCIK